MGRLIIAIDGPAGSGKSTVAKLLAKTLGLLYIDTGAMYRALTLKAMREKIDLNEEGSLIALAGSTTIDLKEEGDGLRVSLDGEDVTGLIRTNELTNNVKYVAKVPGVRSRMVEIQRNAGAGRGAVLEGRDIGTVVFPDARFKFYLDADVEERVRRRYQDLAALGQRVSMRRVEEDILVRDGSDMSRSVGALKKASDAVVLDTTNMTVDEVVAKIVSYIGKG